MPSSSLFLRSSTTLVSVLSLASVSVSSVIPNPFGHSDTYYALDVEYSGQSFLDGFTFNSDADLTHGFVTYVDKSTAVKSDLVTFDGDSVQLKADSEHTYDGNAEYWLKNGVGRPSIRIESTKQWTHGLFVADIKHAPTTSTTEGCGTWPAFWTLGDGDWPDHGEIDIFEGANNQGTTLSALHTGNTFTVKQSPLEQTGTPNGNDCQYYEGQTNSNGAGCASFDKRAASYGPDFNAAGGGVYALQWESDAIKIWFFPRGQIPSDLSEGKPEPDTWGLPSSIFNGPNADIDANFKNHRIIFDNTFCGDFGDATWNNGCSAITNQQKCSVFVGSNPEEFSETYWDINYVRIYQSKDKPPTTTTTTTTTITTTTTSAYVVPTSATLPTYTTSASHSTTTSSVPGSQPSSTTSTWSHPDFHGTSSSSHSFGGHPTSSVSAATTTSKPSSPTGSSSTGQPWDDWTSSSTTTSKPSSPTGSSSVGQPWDDWTSFSTTTKKVDPAKSTTTTVDPWADWTSSSTTTKKDDPVKSTSTPVHPWADWVSSSSTTKPVDPAKTTSTSVEFVWSDWVASSSTTKPVDPAKTTSTSVEFVWSDWVASSSSTKPVAPVTTAPAGNQGGWPSAAPTATVATTYTVAPVQSSVTAVAPVQSYTGTGVKPAAATYTGAAGRTQLSSFALGAAGILAGAALAF